MNRIYIWFLLTATALGQATPPGYLYPKPLPVSGATPPSYIVVSGVINPSDYSDPRPMVWDVMVGGGAHPVSTIAERNSIIAGRRKEGMLIYVIADMHLYRLDTDMTSWVDIGALTAGSIGPLIDGTVTLAKLADLAQDQFVGRVSASTGVPETATITAAARTVLDDTTVGAMVDTLGGATSGGTGGLARLISPTFSSLSAVGNNSSNIVRIGNSINGVTKISDVGGGTSFSSKSPLYVAYEGTDSDPVTIDSSSVTAPGIAYRRSRGTLATPTDVVESDQIGYLDFRGYSGTKYWQVAGVQVHIDAPVVSGQSPATHMRFNTCDVNGTAFEGGRLDRFGNWLIGATAQSGRARMFVSQLRNMVTGDYAIIASGATNVNQSYGIRLNAGTSLSDGPIYAYDATALNLLFSVNAIGATYVSKQLGIGATASDNLTIKDASAAMSLTSTNGVQVAYCDYINTGGIVRIGRERDSGGGLVSGSLPYAGVLSVQSAHPLQFGTGSEIKQTITSTGDVGIGTNAPAAKLHVVGDIIADNISGAATSTTRAAGKVGERMSSVIASGSAVSLTTATTANVTSITLTPGNWIVFGKVNFAQAGVTGTDYQYGQSTTSATIGADPTYGQIPLITTTITGTLKQNIPQQSYSVTTATTTQVFLVAKATFTLGTVGAYGEIYALRTD